MDGEAVEVEVLARADALRLLASVQYGRIVFTVGALPAVQPVNFCLDQGRIVIRTASESKLAAAGAAGAVLGFEVDDIDVATRAGWSVVVIGQAGVIDDPAETARLDTLRLGSWAVPTSRRYLCITLDRVTGRWLHSPTPDF